MIDTIPTDWLEICLTVMDTDPTTRDDNGPVGLSVGQRRPELGAGIQDLGCGRCGATWAGIVGDPCWWCENTAARNEAYQARLLLRAPDSDPNDETWQQQMDGWADRLVVGVQAGIIDQRQAEMAWGRTARAA